LAGEFFSRDFSERKEKRRVRARARAKGRRNEARYFQQEEASD